MNELEKRIFRIANNVLYFDDSSDYSSALWEILEELNPKLFKNNCSPLLEYIEESGNE